MELVIPINTAAWGGAALLPPASQGSPDPCRGSTRGDPQLGQNKSADRAGAEM